MNILSVACIVAAVSMATASTAETIGRTDITPQGDRMTPEALWAMGRVGGTAVSPKGDKIAYMVTYYSVELNRSRAVIYTMNADGSGQRSLTGDERSESEPAFIDGGERLAFVCDGQLWTMTPDGGDRQQLTDCDGGIDCFRFSPDGTHVILIREVPATGSIQPKEADLPMATGMVIDDMNYKHWDRYVTTIPHLFLARRDGAKVYMERDILEGEPYECPTLPFGGTEQFAWSPDGKQIAYTCNKRTGVAYAVSTDTDIYLYNIETGETKNLCKPADYVEPATDNTISLQNQAKNQSTEDINAGYDQDPQFSPDGTMLAWRSMARDGYESDRTRLCVLNLTTGEKRYVTEGFESGVEEFVWAKDNNTLYFAGVWHGRTMIYSTNLRGEVKPITTGDYDYADISPMPGGDKLLAKRHSLSAPDDIYLITLPERREEATIAQLTHENDHILLRLALGEVRERWVKTTDGKEELCWVVYPSHFDPSRRYPALLFCEGGPQTPVSQFWSYRWNLQIMAANDYIVIAPNRRGLPGFGMEWLEEISGDYTGQCMRDYLSAIDDICREPYVDSDRLGCVGASFGGYSVYWLAGNHEGRFKAFIAHDGIFNTHQQYYETEEMWFPNWDLGGSPDRVAGNAVFTESPHLYVDKWDTPILCIHGERDYRILHSQGQSAFCAARMHGVPAQLLLYPDENHWVLKPQNGVLWQRTFFRWLDRWLK